jgi:hypothetical protein
MTQLEQARIFAVEVTDKGVKPSSIPGIDQSGFAVQFNPTSLRLQRSNNTSGEPGQRAAQSTGNDTTLNVELLFDTADEGTTEAPLDVRERTGKVAAFVLPVDANNKKNPPPGIRFHWGSVDVSGIMTSYSEDIEMFDASGIALRARVSITIKEQDPNLMSLRRGPGAAQAPPATPASTTAAPGTSGSAKPDSTAFAQAGETLPELAARVGLEPEAWRALSVASDAVRQGVGALNSVLGQTASVGGGVAGALTAGARVDFDSSASAAVGVGGAAVVSSTAAGMALSAKGGVTASLQSAMATRAAAASGAAWAAFGMGSAAARSAQPALAGFAAGASTQADSRRVVADRRAVTYGQGVPLRSRRSTLDPGVASPYVVVQPQLTRSPAMPDAMADPRISPWEQLPATSPGRRDADSAQQRRTPSSCSCTCSCGCTSEVV